MKDASIFFFALLPAAVCAIVAAVLAYKGKDGWGWFLFAAILLAVSWKSKS